MKAISCPAAMHDFMISSTHDRELTVPCKGPSQLSNYKTSITGISNFIISLKYCRQQCLTEEKNLLSHNTFIYLFSKNVHINSLAYSYIALLFGNYLKQRINEHNNTPPYIPSKHSLYYQCHQ